MRAAPYTRRELKKHCSRRFRVQSFGHVFQVLIFRARYARYPPVIPSPKPPAPIDDVGAFAAAWDARARLRRLLSHRKC